MSAQEFKPGDRVRCIETWTTHVIDSGDEFTVEETARVLTGIDAGSNRVFVQGEWVPARYFEKVEPEFVVGQQVSGDDYARLPVGTVVEHHSGVVRTKSADGRWVPEPAHFLKLPDDVMESQRTITHLPDATEPEDTDDVEPEPLQAGDAVLVWATVDHVRGERIGLHFEDDTNDDFATASADAIVRPSAGQVPPWVKPAEEPLNIGAVIADRDDAVWARVATGDPGGPWWTRASEGPEESMTYPHHWGDLDVREVLSGGYMDGGAS